MKLDCNAVRELLPSYMDDKGSLSNAKYIKRHLSECESCRKIFDSMCSEASVYSKKSKKDKKHFSKRIKVAAWTCFGVVCLSFLLVVFTFAGVLQPLFDKYDPSVSALIEITEPTEEWQTAKGLAYLESDSSINRKDYLEYRTILAKKKASCLFPGGDENVVVEMRILDEENNVVVGPLALTSVSDFSVGELKLNKQYTVQYRSLTPGHYTLQFE